jgi:GT2 family glycosyltransferase
VAVAVTESSRPRITFALVTYGGRQLVRRCLELLAEHTPRPYRVIIVDSASPDGTGQWLAEHSNRLPGDVTVLRMGSNLGFGAGCTLAARHADTELICLLNADVEVTAGWLEPLLDLLDANPAAAAVAPLMVNPDGSVQEAGSIVGGDGWCRAYDAVEESLFVREVEYASAACLVLRLRAFHEVGAFSPDYEIAYFEDVDLAMSLRRRGWQTLVQPASRVVHARHGSSSSERAMELMRLNHSTFCHRWADELGGRQPVVGLDEHPHRLWWLRDRLAPYRVLLVDDRVPQADRGRGDPRTMAVLDAWRLADPRARVTFFAVSPERAQQYAPALQARGIEVVWGEPDAAAWSRRRRGLYDVIVVFRPHNFDGPGKAIARAQPQAVRVYDSEALFHRRPEQHFATATHSEQRRAFAIEADRLRRQEAEAFNWADVAVCVSEDEAHWARRAAPATLVHVACYPADPPTTVLGRDGRRGLVFFGGFDSTPGTPNEFAVLELAGKVFPALRSRHRGLGMRVVGADPSPAVLDLAGRDGVEVLGKVLDPRPVLASALLHVVPMRYGAGVKIKFVDSMAAGLPFVTTPIGGEGLHLGAVARHLIGTSNAELIELSHRLLADAGLWTDVQQALLRICRKHFSVDKFIKNMAAVLADCALPPPTPLGNGHVGVPHRL